MWTKCTGDASLHDFYILTLAASVNFHLFPSRSEKIDSLHVSLILHGSFMAMICKYLLKRNQQKNPNDNQQTNLLWIFLGFRFRLKSKFLCLCFQSNSSQAAEGIKNPTDVLQFWGLSYNTVIHTNKFTGKTFQAAHIFLISAQLNFHRVDKIWAHF